MPFNEAEIKKVVSRADLYIEGTVRRSEGGLPIGNGVMGTLVWTSPAGIKAQVNRSDVFANNSYSNSFNERHLDYGYACAYLDIDFTGYGEDVFGSDTRQHLDIYSARGSINGNGAAAEFFAAKGRDLFVFSCNTEREEGAVVRLRMLRPSEVQHRSHFAYSHFIIRDDVLILKQEFTEGSYYCASAVAIKAFGKPYRIRQNNESGGMRPGIAGRKHIVLGQEAETETRLCFEGGKGSFDLYVASAAGFDPSADVAKEACAIVNRAAADGRSKIQNETESFWKKFWEKSFIELWGDEKALLAEKHYQYYMYILGCCSEGGKFPPNFGGLLFSTRGDLRHWGIMQWWNNLQIYYNSVMASGRWDLIMPYFNLWNRNIETYAAAARQQWGAEGIFIPETSHFNGPEKLDENIAAELRDLFLARKDLSGRSEEFWHFANKKHPHESRWNFQSEKWENGELIKFNHSNGAFSAVTHMIGSQAGIAYLYWLYYCYSGDREYLEKYGYPIIRGVAEFYRSFPNLKKGEDGRIHIYHTNNSEGFRDCTDSHESISAMLAIWPVAIRAASILGVDAELAAKWAELLSELAPMPVTSKDGRNIWIGGIKENSANDSDSHWPPMLPCRLFNMCTMETQEKNNNIFSTGKQSIEYILNKNPVNSVMFTREMSGLCIALANMGKANEMAEVVAGQINCLNADKDHCYFDDNGRTPLFENRLTAREGINAMSGQRLGNISAAIQAALLQSGGGTPAGDPVIRLFPALPDKWNARFKLFANGGFVVQASFIDGKIRSVEIDSMLGNKLCLWNVWGACSVDVNGVKSTIRDSEYIKLETRPGDKILVNALTP
ncbi:MAG: hypothetical protein FWF22_05665 [Treponema sp.]|nr:hypothetical protein [Treponema sp.]